MNPFSLPPRRRSGGAMLALLLGGAIASGQDAPAPVPVAAPGATPSFTAFQVIGNYNIFNANRIGYTPGAATVRVDTISLVGTIESDHGRLALFDGTDRTYRTAAHEGEKIAEFTVTRITDSGVELTRDGKPLALAMGQQLRRPPGGAWTVGTARRAEPAAAPAAPAVPSDASDILKQLMEQRLKLQKQ